MATLLRVRNLILLLLSASSTPPAASGSNIASQGNMAANHQSTSQRETPSLASITSPPPSAQSNLTPSLSAANRGSRNTVTHTNHAACSPPSSQPVNPRNIKAILSTNVYDYSLNRLAAYGPLLGTGIFTTDGPARSQSRALPRPTFAKSQIADLATFEALITELLVLLPTDGRPIDLQELFFGYAIDSATAFLLGRCSHPLRRLGSPASAAASHHDVDFASAFDDAQAAIRTRERLGVLRMSHRDKHADKCFQICHGFVEKAIDDAVRSVRVPRASTTPTAGGKETGRQPPFIDTLLEQTSNRTPRRDELMNLLPVGRDTTASLLSNLFSMLARHPDTVVAGWGVGWFEGVRLWFLVWSGSLVR